MNQTREDELEESFDYLERWIDYKRVIKIILIIINAFEIALIVMWFCFLTDERRRIFESI